MAGQSPTKGRLTLDDFLEKMWYDSGLAGGRVYKRDANSPYGYWGNWSNWDNAQWQPHALIFGLPLPEPIFHTIVDYMCGTTGLWWEYTKVREGISLSPTSRMHGDMLGKQSFQRKDAKEMMATVQTMKTVILNLESDLEKIGEQKKAFASGNPEQIKGLFVDNFGGPSRSWSALAHQVPIVRSALTWFYRLDEKPADKLGVKSKPMTAKYDDEYSTACQKDMEVQAEAFVKTEELNPAVANYLKRKVQEYWTWRMQYRTFINKTFNSIVENLRQQRANLQLYLRWATRNIQEAENMVIPYEEMWQTYQIFDEEFPQFAPLAYTVTDMFYDPEKKWPIVIDRLKPWIPCMAIQLLMSYNPELQGNKFVRGFAILSYGVIHQKDKKYLQDRLKLQKDDFVEIMKTYGGYSDDEMLSLGLSETPAEKAAEKYKGLKAKGDALTPAEKEEMSKLAQEIGIEAVEAGKTVEEAKSSIVKELSGWFAPKGKAKSKELYYATFDWRESMLATITPVLKFFGNEVPKTFDTRLRRASWFSYNSFWRVYRGIKSNMGWMHYE